MPPKPRCQAIKTNKLRCKNCAITDHNFCKVHMPKQEEMVDANLVNTNTEEQNDNLEDIVLPPPPSKTDKKIQNNLLIKNKIHNQDIQAKPEFTEARILRKARILFYNEHKEDAVIVDFCNKNILAAFQGNPHAPKKAPWQCMFACTNVLFDALEQTSINMYLQNARNELNANKKTNNKNKQTLST